jgi:hypothetical protein
MTPEMSQFQQHDNRRLEQFVEQKPSPGLNEALHPHP